jgi:CspA family cold shock protein
MRINPSTLISLKSCNFLHYKESFRSRVAWAFNDCFLRQSGGLGLGTKLFKEVCAVAEGTVKWYSKQKGYGSIEQDDRGEIFVNHSAINMPGFKTLSEGGRVLWQSAANVGS